MKYTVRPAARAAIMKIDRAGSGPSPSPRRGLRRDGQQSQRTASVGALLAGAQSPLSRQGAR